MAHVGELKLVVLWEEELRVAAKAAARFRELNAAGVEGDALGVAVIEFLNAASAALNGAEHDERALVLSSVPKRKAKR